MDFNHPSFIYLFSQFKFGGVVKDPAFGVICRTSEYGGMRSTVSQVIRGEKVYFSLTINGVRVCSTLANKESMVDAFCAKASQEILKSVSNK